MPNDYKKYIKKCDLLISIDSENSSNSFIPYYLRAFSKIICGEDDDSISKDLNKSLVIINKEIHRYSYIFKILKKLNINADFPFYQTIILLKIKVIIEKNIKDYEKMKDSDLILHQISLCKLILAEKNDKEEINNKNIRLLKNNINILSKDGLNYIFFLDEKSFIWKFRDFFVGLIKLFINSLIKSSPIGIIDILKTGINLPFKYIFKKIYNRFLKKNPEKDEIPELHDENYYFDKDFQIFDEDINFLNYLSNRKNVELYKEYDLNKLLERDDKKIRLVEEEIIKTQLYKNVNKLCLFSKELELDKILDFAQKEIRGENSNEEKINYIINEFKKGLNENRIKGLLGYYFLRLKYDAEDIYLKGYKNLKNIYEIIDKKSESLKNFLDLVIKEVITNQFNKNIEEQKKIWNNKKQKSQENLKIFQEKKNKNSKDILLYNSKRDEYNKKVEQINEYIKKFKMDNNENQNILKDFKKKSEEIDNERKKLELENKNLNIELKKINEEIDECNKLNKEINNKIDILNNLSGNLIIGCSKEQIKIDYKNLDIKCAELEELLRNIEHELNLVLDQEIKTISKSLICEENNNKIIKKIVDLEDKIEKVINGKNQLLYNCFNKSFSKNRLLYI